MKFAYNGKILFVPKKPLRYNLSWDSLDSVGVVTGKEISIGGQQFLARLPLGMKNNPCPHFTAGDDPSVTHGSEWNKLMYYVSSYLKNVTSEPLAANFFASYNPTDLGCDLNSNGRNCIVQETIEVRVSDTVLRGSGSATYAQGIAKSYVHVTMGWRPVLELVV